MSLKLLLIPIAVLGCNGNRDDSGYSPRALSADTTAAEIAEADSFVVPQEPAAPVSPGPESVPAQEKDEVPAGAGSTMPAGHYHLVVSFYSPGMGINKEGYASFKDFLGRNSGQLAYEETRWGREGEVDFCIRYEKDAAAHPAEMTRKIRTHLAGFDRINFLENSPCVHKR